MDQPSNTINIRPKKPPRVPPIIGPRSPRMLLPWPPSPVPCMSVGFGGIVVVVVISVTMTEPSGSVEVAEDTMTDVLGGRVLPAEEGEVTPLLPPLLPPPLVPTVGQEENRVVVGVEVVTGMVITNCDSTVVISWPGQEQSSEYMRSSYCLTLRKL